MFGKRLRNVSGRCITPSLLNTLLRTGVAVITENGKIDHDSMFEYNLNVIQQNYSHQIHLQNFLFFQLQQTLVVCELIEVGQHNHQF